MNITVIGQGYVGLVNSVILASFFHNVIGLDNDKNKVATLKQGIATIKEPNLQSLMSDAKDRLRVLRRTPKTRFAPIKSSMSPSILRKAKTENRI